jgi:hypothetical protein
LHHGLNPLHDTRHDTRLPVLRRSTDRWPLTKNSTTRLKGLERWHGAGLLSNCSIPITNTKGLYLYPCPNTTLSRPRLQHLLPKLMPRRQCPSRTRHQFVPSLHSSHVITYSRMLSLPSAKQSFCRMTTRSRMQAPLPNAMRKTSCRTVLSYQTRPISQSLPSTIFGVNICPFNYGIKGDFIPELTINAQRLQAESVQHPFFPSSNRWSFRPDPNPSSSTFQASVFKWRTKTKLFR